MHLRSGSSAAVTGHRPPSLSGSIRPELARVDFAAAVIGQSLGTTFERRFNYQAIYVTELIQLCDNPTNRIVLAATTSGIQLS
jgi:hypothetical protein